MTELAIPGTGPDGDADPLELYARGLAGTALYLRHADGHRELLPTRRWTDGLQPGDAGLLDRCLGPTLDVGCGPGRLVGALERRGQPALGIDVSPAAVALARGTGASVLLRDVFADVPGAGRWSRLLLADGNIGIGGDLMRLLRRCRGLISARGLVIAEVDGAPAATSRPGSTVRLETGSGEVSSWFPWAAADLGELSRAAPVAGLRVVASWSEAGRVFAALSSTPLPHRSAPAS